MPSSAAPTSEPDCGACSRRGERGRRPRELIDWAIGPVWEANHVWLIFALVVLWTGFPSAFEAVFSTLFIPLSLAALGIVLRGSGFAFHRTARRARGRAARGACSSALSSVLTPFFMGTVVGAVAGGRVPVGNAAGDSVTSWVNPLSLVIGALFVATGAYLSAVFLVSDSRRAGAPDLEQYFATRALVAAVVTGALAAAGLVVLHSHARFVFDGLKGDALPLVILSALCGIAVLVLLAARGPARGAAARGGRGRLRHLGLGHRAAPVPAAGDAQDLRRSRAERHADGRVGRLRSRSRLGAPRRSGCCSRSPSAASSRRPAQPGRIRPEGTPSLPSSAPARGGLVLGALIAVAAVANLGLAIANVALPSIGRHFDASQTALNLVAVGYSLGLAASVLYFGAIGDRYGRKLLLILGMLLTVPADCLAAWAPSIEVLFGARVLGGLAAGMAYPTTLALITALWSGPARTRSIALWAAIGGALSALGPLCPGSCSSTSGGDRSSCSRCRSRGLPW